jgi:hypothetical protein
MRLSRLLPARVRRKLRSVALTRAAEPGAAFEPLPESSPFLHVIATRHGIGVFDEQWFAYRQLMLEHLTLASLDAQTRRDFLWVVAVDREMPPAARSRLEAFAADRPYLRIAETELKRDFVPDLVAFVRKEAKARGKDWVLTTRMDDDDAIHRDHVGRLHRETHAYLAEGHGAPVVLVPGLGCKWVPREAAGHRAYNPSLGLSLLEPAKGAATVYRRNHSTLTQMLVPQGVNVRHLDGQTMWWLYTHTALSDQQRDGSERMSKVADHPHAFALDATTLAQFGVTADGARLLRRTPEPEPHETLHLLNRRGLDVEQEIHDLRAALRDNDDGRLRERIAKLHAERRRMHERLIRSLREFLLVHVLVAGDPVPDRLVDADHVVVRDRVPRPHVPHLRPPLPDAPLVGDLEDRAEPVPAEPRVHDGVALDAVVLLAGLHDDLREARDRAALHVPHRGLEVQLAALAALARPVEDPVAVDVGLLEVPVAKRHVGVHAGVQVRHAVDEVLGGRALERDDLEALGAGRRGFPQAVEFGLVHGVEVADADRAFEGLLEALAHREGPAEGADRVVARSGHGNPRGERVAPVRGRAFLGVPQQGRADAAAALVRVHGQVHVRQVRVVEVGEVEAEAAEHPTVADRGPVLVAGVGTAEHQGGQGPHRVPRAKTGVVVLFGDLLHRQPGLHHGVIGRVDRDDVEMRHGPESRRLVRQRQAHCERCFVERFGGEAVRESEYRARAAGVWEDQGPMQGKSGRETAVPDTGWRCSTRTSPRTRSQPGEWRQDGCGLPQEEFLPIQ